MEVRPRPRFERHTHIVAEVLRDRLKDAIQRSEGKVTGEVLDSHAQLMIAGPQRHTWSPCLSITYTAVEDDEGARLRIRGLFGPRPALWTMVATLYGFSAFMIFVGTMVGWSQSIIDRAPSGFLAIPAGIALATILYVASLSGQALAHDEMHELTELLDRALDGES